MTQAERKKRIEELSGYYCKGNDCKECSDGRFLLSEIERLEVCESAYKDLKIAFDLLRQACEQFKSQLEAAEKEQA